MTEERLREIEASSWADSEDVQLLIAALKQAREERDGYAAALQSANQVVTRFGGWLDRWSLPGREKKTSDVYGAWDRVREEAKWGDPVGNPLDPAECLKARDAEIRQQVIREMDCNNGVRNT